jgi:hypothetical protein
MPRKTPKPSGLTDEEKRLLARKWAAGWLRSRTRYSAARFAGSLVKDSGAWLETAHGQSTMGDAATTAATTLSFRRE